MPMLGGPKRAPGWAGAGGGWRRRSGASDSGRCISVELSPGVPKIGASVLSSGLPPKLGGAPGPDGSEGSGASQCGQ
jgi:hypothetical protein